MANLTRDPHNSSDRPQAGASPTASLRPEEIRIRAFLNHIDADSSRRERAIEEARAISARLEQRLELAREELARRDQELAGLRAEREQTQRDREHEVAQMTERLLQEKLAGLLGDIRAQVVAQYDERLAAAHLGLDAERAAAALARQNEQKARDELEAALATARADLARSSQEHDQALAKITAQFELASSTIQNALAEKDRVLELAQANVRNLQDETMRLRAASEQDLQALRAKYSADAGELEKARSRAIAERDELRKKAATLEAVVEQSDNLQRLRELEQQCAELTEQCEAQSELLGRMAAALGDIHQLVTKSPAARSILGGAGTGIDLDSIFDPLADL